MIFVRLPLNNLKVKETIFNHSLVCMHMYVGRSSFNYEKNVFKTIKSVISKKIYITGARYLTPPLFYFKKVNYLM